MIDASNVEAKQTPRFEQKREMILDAAARLFHQHGLDGVTLSDVGEKVGLATNSVTYYYRRKENLVAACFERAFTVFGTLVAEASQLPDVEARVSAFVHNYFHLLAEIDDGRRSDLVNFSNLAAVRGDIAGPIGDAYTALFRDVRQMVSLGADESTGSARVNTRAHLLLALSQWSRVWLRRYETDGYARAARHVAAIFLHGVAAPGRRGDAIRSSPGTSGSIIPGHADNAPVRGLEPILSRELFLRAATQLINKHGFNGTSVERIAASLNATKGAFYHHNVDKQEMIAACFERSFAVIRAAQNAAVHEPDGLARLEYAASALVRFQLSDAGPLLRIVELTRLPVNDGVAVLATMNRLSERFASFVTDGMIDGSIRPVDATAASQMLQGMISAAASTTRWAPDISPQEAVNCMLGPLLHGICGDRRTQ